MEKIENISAQIGAGINVNAAQANNVNKNETVVEKSSNHYNIGIKADLENPEITGSDTFEMKVDFPFGGGLSIKATSNVTSSVAAQQVLNEQARQNMAQLGEFLAKAAMALVPTYVGFKEAEREQEKLDSESYEQRRRKEAQLDIELETERAKHNHERELEDAKWYHEKRMLNLQLDEEYNRANSPEE